MSWERNGQIFHMGDHLLHIFGEHLVGIDTVLGPIGAIGSISKVNLISFFLLYSISLPWNSPPAALTLTSAASSKQVSWLNCFQSFPLHPTQYAM